MPEQYKELLYLLHSDITIVNILLYFFHCLFYFFMCMLCLCMCVKMHTYIPLITVFFFFDFQSKL